MTTTELAAALRRQPRVTLADLPTPLHECPRLTAAVYGLPVRLSPDEVIVYDDYYGQGYGLPTAAGLAAIRLVARTEGILLDPVYTGKAMSGLMGLAQRGILRPEHTAVFVHTGGIPALFAYHQELMAAG